MSSPDFPNLNASDFNTLTPVECETMARWIIRELSKAETVLKENQELLAQTEHDLEVEMARSRFNLAIGLRENGKAYTEQQKQDNALITNEKMALETALLKVKVDVAKKRIDILKTQSELVRSVMVSVRESMKEPMR